MKTFNHVSVSYAIPKLNRIDRKEGRVYEYEGTLLPSITTVLGWSKREIIQEWREKIGDKEADRIMNLAGATGTDVHNLIEKYLSNTPNLYRGIFPDIKSSFLTIKSIVDRIDNIRHLEQPLFSTTLGVAGTVDCIADFDGVPSIIDFKTSMKIKDESIIQSYFQQETAYSLMYEELTGNVFEKIVTIMSIDHENTALLFVKQRKDYIETLKETIAAYKKEFYNVS